jgi:hypothetical protein
VAVTPYLVVPPKMRIRSSKQYAAAPAASVYAMRLSPTDDGMTMTSDE